jgi:hypothetical protein
MRFREDFLRAAPTARELARALDRYRVDLLYVPIDVDEIAASPFAGVMDVDMLAEGHVYCA